MSQLHLYVPDREADELKARAQALGMTVSRYLATLVHRELGKGWPEDYFKDVLGAWHGDLERPPQGDPERRDPL